MSLDIVISFLGSDEVLDRVSYLLVETAIGNRVAWSEEDSARVGDLAAMANAPVGGHWPEIKNSAGGPWWLEEIAARGVGVPASGWNCHLDLALSPGPTADETRRWDGKVAAWQFQDVDVYYACLIASILREVPETHAVADMQNDMGDSFNSERRIFVFDRDEPVVISYDSEDGYRARGKTRKIEATEARWKAFRDELKERATREAFESGTLATAGIGEAKIGDTVEFGRYPESGLPVTWKVLATKGDGILLLSVFAPSIMKFGRKGCGWEKSEAREWLNGSFMEGFFDDEEVASIVPYGEDAFGSRLVSEGLVEGDRVFCLSSNDAKRYLKGVSAKITKTTPYVNGSVEPCVWWLRSPGDPDFHFAQVGSNGRISAKGMPPRFPAGIRPALFVRR